MIKDIFESEEQAMEVINISHGYPADRPVGDSILTKEHLNNLKQSGAIRKSTNEVAFDKLMEYVEKINVSITINGQILNGSYPVGVGTLKELILNYKAAMKEKK